MLLDTLAVSLLYIGNARTNPLNSSRITCTECSFPPLLCFWTIMKSVAIRCPKAVVGSSAPLSLKGLGRNLLTFLRYILDHLQIEHAGFFGKCSNCVRWSLLQRLTFSYGQSVPHLQHRRLMNVHRQHRAKQQRVVACHEIQLEHQCHPLLVRMCDVTHSRLRKR